MTPEDTNRKVNPEDGKVRVFVLQNYSGTTEGYNCWIRDLDDPMEEIFRQKKTSGATSLRTYVCSLETANCIDKACIEANRNHKSRGEFIRKLDALVSELEGEK